MVLLSFGYLNRKFARGFLVDQYFILKAFSPLLPITAILIFFSVFQNFSEKQVKLPYSNSPHDEKDQDHTFSNSMFIYHHPAWLEEIESMTELVSTQFSSYLASLTESLNPVRKSDVRYSQ